MTVSTSTNKTIIDGNGATTVFAFGFPIPDISEIFAIYTDLDGVEHVLTRLIDYSVSGIGNPSGGSITYPLSGSPIAMGTTITIIRLVQYVQLTSIANQGAFYPEVIEATLDYLTFQTQQIAEQSNRSVNLNLTSQVTVPVLSDPVADTVLMYNDDATLIIPGPSAADIGSAQAYAVNAAASAVASAASATLSAASAATIANLKLATTTNIGNAYSATYSPASVLTDGALFRLLINAANTGAATLNLDGHGDKALKKGYSTALSSGDIVNHQSIIVSYDLTNDWFQTIAGIGISGGGGGGSAGTYLNNTITVSGATQALDLATYGSYFITMQASCTFSFSASPTSGSNLNEALLVFLQDSTGGRTITLPAAVVWSGTTSPTAPPTLGYAANSYTAIRLKTKDSGTTWIATLEGTGGSGGGNVPVAGLYLFGGAGMKANKSSDGTTLSSSSPNFASGTTDVVAAVYNPVYSKFYVLGKNNSGSAAQPSGYIQYSTNGTTYTSVTDDSGNEISANIANDLVQFSNGNMMTTHTNGSGIAAFCSDGAQFKGTGLTGGGPATRAYWPAIVANSGMFVQDGSAVTFSYTLDGGQTFTAGIHGGATVTASSAAYVNGNYVVGGALGGLSYKTLVSSTTLLATTPNLTSEPTLGCIFAMSKYIAWTATSISNNSTINGTYTSRTTAFFTTAGMTGNIVSVVANVAGTVTAYMDTGDIGVSMDGGTTWAKLSNANNPQHGTQIRKGLLLNGNFYSLSDAGAIAYSTTGTAFTALTSTGFGSNAVLCAAAG